MPTSCSMTGLDSVMRDTLLGSHTCLILVSQADLPSVTVTFDFFTRMCEDASGPAGHVPVLPSETVSLTLSHLVGLLVARSTYPATYASMSLQAREELTDFREEVRACWSYRCTEGHSLTARLKVFRVPAYRPSCRGTPLSPSDPPALSSRFGSWCARSTAW